MKPSAPKMSTVIISLVLILVGFIGAFAGIDVIASNGDTIMFVGYLLLLAGVFTKGL